ncbi:MAG: sec-independent protein translocase protein TatB [Sphingomonadales bacterium]|jgi:sec-independent protein translocase protein TatB|nr:sec-independent protein translocase protein TatB [Sphingomonadales bacterium]
MFGIDSGELLIIAVVALVVIGPKDLPNVMRTVGGWIARARGMATHFRAGIDTMIRETELEEMQKKWAADNERIMREHPMPKPGAAPEPPPQSDAIAPPAAAPAASGEGARRPPPPAPPRRPAPAAPPRAAPAPPPKELP